MFNLSSAASMTCYATAPDCTATTKINKATVFPCLLTLLPVIRRPNTPPCPLSQVHGLSGAYALTYGLAACLTLSNNTGRFGRKRKSQKNCYFPALNRCLHGTSVSPGEPDGSRRCEVPVCLFEVFRKALFSRGRP